MVIKNIKTVDQEVAVDVICDICRKSCMIQPDDYWSAEYIELEANWGYYTQSDGEHWKAHVCYDCTKKHLENLIHFDKKYQG